MAKRNTKTVKTEQQKQYNKEKARIQRQVKALEKRGYIFQESPTPKTPKTITESSVNRLKKIDLESLYRKAEYIDEDTGEIVSGKRGRQLERKKSQQKARVTVNERKTKTDKLLDDGFESFSSEEASPFEEPIQKSEEKKRDKPEEKRGEKQQKQEKQKYDPKRDGYLPDGGEIMYQNLVDQFISKLQEPPSNVGWNKFRGTRYKRPSYIVDVSERSKEYLLDITNNAVASVGKSAIGWRLHDHEIEVQFLLDIVLYGSNSEGINTATVKLATIINGASLTHDQLKDLAEQSEYNEDHEYPE